MEKFIYSLFGGFSLLFILCFVAVFLFIVRIFVKIIRRRIAERRFNDSQPISTKEAKILSKRTLITGGGESSVYTTCLTTFEFSDNKERAEFKVPFKEYGLIKENDLGNLTFQGRRFLKFERSKILRPVN